MKRLLIFAATILIPVLTFSQVLTLSDLISIGKKNHSEAESFVSTKGYEYDGIDVDEEFGADIYYYYYNKNGTSYDLTNTRYYDEDYVVVTWDTDNLKDLEDFKTQLSPAGFTFIESGTRSWASYSTYKKDKITVSLNTKTDTDTKKYSIVVSF